MTGDQTASLLYLVLLGSVIAGSLFLSGRQNWGKNLRQAGIWALIFIGVVAVYGLWNDIQSTMVPRQTVFAEEDRIEVPRARDGHYHLSVAVNGTPIRFIVDTGATDIVLSTQDARKVGIDPDELSYAGAASTANGQVSTARVRLDEVAIGPITDRGVSAVVSQGDMPGSLLGMAYLERFAQVTFGNGRMVLDR